MTSSAQLAYRFNGFRVDPVRRLLFGADGQPIPLKPKVFDTLLYLVERPGELVDKRALLEAVWPHVVVEENNLNKAISTLRQVFGETRDEHRFIVTEPGRGYRFVASVEAMPTVTTESPPGRAEAVVSPHADGAARGASSTSVVVRSPADASNAPERNTPMRPSRSPRAAYFVTAAVAGGLGAALVWFLSRDTDARWLQEELVPQIEAHLDTGDWEAAYALAQEAEARLPDDSELLELWPRFSWLVTIESEPPGAAVYRRAYNGTDADWQELGRTPLRDIRIPFGLSRVRLALDGYAPMLRTLGGGVLVGANLLPDFTGNFYIGPEIFKLDRTEELPEGKVRVSGFDQVLDGASVQLRDYFLDRYEVTNAQFKAFVDAGGYRQPQLWAPVVRDGQIVPWDEAMPLFTDRTGRLGPSTWEAGDYPDGRDEYPVSGVGWYEADAYARFMGQELPTVHHWLHALPLAELSWLLPASNLDAAGPLPVGQSGAMNYSGTFDMTGNVREWSATARGDQRAILGGGWTDQAWTGDARALNAAPPLDRSPSNGLRLAATHDEPAVAARARAALPPLPAPPRPEQQPVSDEVYAAYSRVFAYDAAAQLNASIDAEQSTRLWTRQRIVFDAAYGGERMVLYLYLPSTGVPPYQTVIYWPGAAARFLGSIDEYSTYMDFVVKSGRAVAFPVYKGTFERGAPTPFPARDTPAYRDNTIQAVNDLRRSIDYLASRSDIDQHAIAYFGHSWGGSDGVVALAQEPRFATAVIYVGFLPRLPMQPEVEPVNALPRVRLPVLMMSSEFDGAVPLENARRYFELIGTPAAAKKHVISSGGHFVPRDVLIRETLDWLDMQLASPEG